MEKWFKKQSRLVQIILLLVPVVNWVVEAGVRWGHALRVKKHKGLKVVLAIIATIPTGILFGWLDLVWVLLFKHLVLCK